MVLGARLDSFRGSGRLNTNVFYFDSRGDSSGGTHKCEQWAHACERLKRGDCSQIVIVVLRRDAQK